ncbi:DNA-3-methyladenine glycosylase II [Desulfosporosinus hippei DSM 8344]|uniref:DNA-3-methyladenine glycosylase II n=2 Tax=Desulfosporosinus TaxID=79206 RepID=A0A1G7VPX3_9FIRM|nr:DNA-3-methyladenine glycosylase [Desulfosporosinus hippei]SDG61856.1 DNA-3-methyladenine glycosylase II [Desulfosporosinus hippei DSM 8344]
MPDLQYFDYGEKEIQWLKARDPILGAAMDEIGHINRPVIPDMFTALVNAIVGQQISTKAQATIWNRMLEKCSFITPESLRAISAEELQSCGISMRKALYIKEIADSVLKGSLNLRLLQTMSDEQGIGVWTAEMLLIFSLQRPDVMSWYDLAILRGLRMLYHHCKITPQLFNKYKRRYSPYATVASLYLWAIAGGACQHLVDYQPKKAALKKETELNPLN